MSVDQPLPMEPTTDREDGLWWIGQGERCHAKNRRMEQCQKRAVDGSKVCAMHGGGTRATREKAAVIQMEMMRTMALELHEEMLQDDKIPPGVQARLIEMVYDRTGLHKTTEVEVTQVREMARERIEQILAARTPAELEVIEAEIVSDDQQPPLF